MVDIRRCPQYTGNRGTAVKIMKNFFGVKKINEKIENSEFSIKKDKFDAEAFNRIMKHNDELRHTMNEGVEDYAPFDNLLQDTFSSLYKYSPELLKDYEMKPDFLLNSTIMSQIMESPKYKELRALTKLDDVNATVGTEILSDQLKELLEQAKKQRQALQDMLDASSEVGKAQAAAGLYKDEDGEEKSGEPRALDRKTLEEAKKVLAEAEKDYKESVEEKTFKHSVSEAVSMAQHATQETSDFIENWGLGNDSNYSKQSYRGKMDLLNRIRSSDKLQQIAKLAGRYKAIAMQRQHMKIKKGVSEIYAVKQGKDIARLLPSELMKLNDPLLEDLFYKDLLEGKTLQYETRSRGKEIRGPILVAVDESGSMGGASEVWSKAVALGLMEIARNQKRDFGFIHFSGDQNPKSLRVDYFLKNDPYNIEKIIDTVEYFDNGGTYFEAPLKRARQIIDDHEAFTKADITFITDGESAVSDKFVKDFNKWKTEKKVSLTSILIDTGYGSSTATLAEFTRPEHIIRLKELKDEAADSVAIQIFDKI